MFLVAQPKDDIKSMKLSDRTSKAFQLRLLRYVIDNNPNDFSDEFEYADNMIFWTLDELIRDTNDNYYEDNRDNLVDFIKDMYGDFLFDRYYSEVDDDEEENDEDVDF